MNNNFGCVTFENNVTHTFIIDRYTGYYIQEVSFGGLVIFRTYHNPDMVSEVAPNLYAAWSNQTFGMKIAEISGNFAFLRNDLSVGCDNF